MNFAKASSVLYPILGENVSDIILSFMKPSNATLKSMQIDSSKINTYKFCKSIGLTKWYNEIFDEMMKTFNSTGDCGKAIINKRDCKDHNQWTSNCRRDLERPCQIICKYFKKPKLLSRESNLGGYEILGYIYHAGLEKDLSIAFLEDIEYSELIKLMKSQ